MRGMIDVFLIVSSEPICDGIFVFDFFQLVTPLPATYILVFVTMDWKSKPHSVKFLVIAAPSESSRIPAALPVIPSSRELP